MTGTLRDSLMELSEEVRVVDLYARVLRGSRRKKLRNRTIAAVAAFMALSGGAVAVAAVRPSPPPVPPIPNPSVTPSPSTEPSPTTSPSTNVVLPNVDIRNATFEVPAFPDDGRCSAGSRAFKNGTVNVRPGEVTDFVKLVMVYDPVRANVDGEPGDEILTRIYCEDYSANGQVLAVKVSPEGKLTSLGYVLISPDHKDFQIVQETLRVQDGTVLVDVTGPTRQDGPMAVLDLQTRGYAYRNGAFQQVSGPTKFARPPGDYRQVDFRNTTAMIRIPGANPQWSTGVTRLSNGKGTIVVDAVSYEVTVVSSAFFNDQPMGVVLYQLKPANGATRTFVNVYQLPSAVVGDYINLMKDTADLTGATKVETNGLELRVTINGQVKTYLEGSDGTWVSSA